MQTDTIVWVVLLAATTTNVAISVYVIGQAPGFRRFLASLPLLGFLGVGINIVVGVSQDPTSHNLWPFEILMSCVIGIVYSLVFLGLSSLWKRQHTDLKTSP